MSLTCPKDPQGRFLVPALFDWELLNELADPCIDEARRAALCLEACCRGLYTGAEPAE